MHLSSHLPWLSVALTAKNQLTYTCMQPKIADMKMDCTKNAFHAAGAARREVLELRGHKEKAAAALASAQRQIMDLTCMLTAGRAGSPKTQASRAQEVRGRHMPWECSLTA